MQCTRRGLAWCTPRGASEAAPPARRRHAKCLCLARPLPLPRWSSAHTTEASARTTSLESIQMARSAHPVNLTRTKAMAKAPAEGSTCEATASGRRARKRVMSIDLMATHVTSSDPAQMVECDSCSSPPSHRMPSFV